MTINLETLRKTAEAEETQKWGGWAFEEDDFDGFCIYINDGDNFGRSYVAKDLTQGESEGESTAEFIATFDPPVVLALLSRLEQAEQAVQRVREMSAHRKEIRLDYVGLIDLDRALDGDGRLPAGDALGGGHDG